MDRKSLIHNVVLLVGVVVCSVVASLLCVQQMWILALLAVVCLFGFVWCVLKQHNEHERKLKFLIEAIGNNDYMFSFGLGKDRCVNEQLNQIKQMLEKARNEAIEREQYYELILDQVSSGVLVVNDRNNVLLMNAWIKRLFGVEQLTHLDNLSCYVTGLSEAFAQTQVDCPNTFSFTNEKEKVNISIHLSTMIDEGALLKIYAVHNIMDELNEKEQESWNKLSRVLTHEIMNSLAPVISLSATLKDKEGISDPQLVEGLESIWYTSNALVRFVENYRKLTHLPTPVKKPILVSDLVSRVITLFRNENCSWIDLQIDIQPADLMFYVDERLLVLLLTNLLKNAVEAIGEDSGVIRILGSSDSYENVVLTVSDTGAEIPNEAIDQIFIPFFTTKKGGSGIGLSLSRQIMRLHSGTITLCQNGRSKSFVLVFK